MPESCHISPLVINSLGGRHTHTNTHIQTLADRSNSKKPGTRRMAGTPGLAIIEKAITLE